MTKLKGSLLILLFVLNLVPLHAQESDDESPYFTISSSKTYATGDKPSIQLWGSKVSTLEFRVYRVNDPVKFFANLQDQHQFGGRAPRIPRQLTWIERFHNWKHQLWANVRDFFRAQFTSASREKIRDWQANREKKPVTQVEKFAQLPLLNSQQLVARWQMNIPAAENRWASRTIPIDVKEKGLYLVEASNGTLQAYTIIIVTDMAMITKVAAGQITAYVVHRQTGKPIPNVSVAMWTEKKQQQDARTNDNGLADFNNVAEQKTEELTVIARQGDDVAVTAPYTYLFNRGAEINSTGYAYTDRPIYRPGDTVHFKGIIRTQQALGYSLPAIREVKVEIRDPEYKPTFQKTLPVSAMGTYSGDFPVPPGAALGSYYLSTSGSNEGSYGGTNFEIEEYKKPEYNVRVSVAKPRVLQGEQITATIDARYYFGEPVANAKVTYVVHQSPSWGGLNEEPDSEDSMGAESEGGDEGDSDNSYDYAGEQTEEKSGKLDAEGKLVITLPTSVDSKKQDVNYRIEARVTDEGNREITGHNVALATYGPFQIAPELDSWVATVGDNVNVKVLARDYDAKPIQTPFRVEVERYSWTSGSKGTWTRIATLNGATDAAGNASVQYHAADAGELRFRAIAPTSINREVEGTHYLWVAGQSQAWWHNRGKQLQFIPDKKSYAPGDTARILITTGVDDAYVLVSVEGPVIYTKEVVHAIGGSFTYALPIRKEYVPNVFLTATFISKNELYRGSKSLNVPADEHRLNITIETSKPQFQPGELALYNVKLTDAAGKPVAAEFSLGVVDEAIYGLRPDRARDIMKEFYGHRWAAVADTDSLSYQFTGTAGKRRMQLAFDGTRPHNAFAQMKPERLVEPKIRKAFPDTNYWAPTLRTGADGRTQVRFNFPDSLTTWRATIRAVTADSKFGSATNKVIVRKNVMVRLVVPRFFRRGDEVTVSTIVHNYLANAKSARVSLDVQGLQVASGATQTVTVPSRGDVKVDWRLKATTSASEAKLLTKALTNEESDAMELTLPIVPFGIKMAAARSGVLTTGEKSDSIAFPNNIDLDSRKLQIDVSPSLAGTIFSALDYLTSYPYGCTEQTMSSFLPNIVVQRAMKDLNLKSNVDQPDLDKKIRAGLDRLYDYQHDSGGWGWWKTDDDHYFMSAYVLSGLAQAKQSGYSVDEQRLKRAQQYLRKAFDANPRALVDLRAYVAYSLLQSGLNDRAVLDAVWSQRSDLTPYGKAMLGLALELANDSRASQLADDVERGAKVTELEAHWELSRDPLLDFYGDNSPEATAYALRFLSHQRPKSELLPKAAFWLINHRDEGYFWESTKQTAMVIYGLTDYLKISGELNPNISAEVAVNGRVVLTRKFTSSTDLQSPIVLRAAQLQPGANTIRVRKTGEGRLYWSARAEWHSTDTKLANTGNLQINMTREYYKLTSERSGDKIVYRMDPLNEPVQIGDIVAVHDVVSGADWKYVMLEDPIPAGTEFIERDDLYELKSKPNWWGWGYTRREFHDDRAAFFMTYFSKREEFRYLLKVVNPGVFKVSPARVGPMYQPSIFATSESQTLEAK